MSIAHIGYRARRRFAFNKRDANHGAIKRALEAAGRQVFDLPGGAGRPDMLVVWGTGFVLIEVKGPDKHHTRIEETQKRFHENYRGPRGTLVIVRSEAEALRAAGVPA